MGELTINTRGASDTHRVGRNFSGLLNPGETVALMGELGTGKTVFVQGIMAGLEFQESVTSPTFNLIHEYNARYHVCHVDCFRLRSSADFYSIGFYEYLQEDSIVLVEWADRIEKYFERWNWVLHFKFSERDDNAREIIVSKSNNDLSADLLSVLQSH